VTVQVPKSIQESLTVVFSDASYNFMDGTMKKESGKLNCFTAIEASMARWTRMPNWATLRRHAFRVGTAVVCLGIFAALGQWLEPADKLAYEIRFLLIIVALSFLESAFTR
jgi:hypothetical protein